jgi:hypothetical protein
VGKEETQEGEIRKEERGGVGDNGSRGCQNNSGERVDGKSRSGRVPSRNRLHLRNNTKSYGKQAMEGNMPMIRYPIAFLE